MKKDENEISLQKRGRISAQILAFKEEIKNSLSSTFSSKEQAQLQSMNNELKIFGKKIEAHNVLLEETSAENHWM